VLDWSENSGKVLIDGEIWNAVATKGSIINKNDSVVVKEYNNMELIVEKIENN